MNQYTETEKTALHAADARKRYKAWMSRPFAGHDVRALREAAKGDADGAFTVPPSPVDPAEADAREALAKLASAWERCAPRAERVDTLREVGALRHLEGPEGNLERAKRRAEADTALGLMLVDALRRKRTVLPREQPFPLVRVARLPAPHPVPSHPALGCGACACLTGRFHCGVCGYAGGRSVTPTVAAERPSRLPRQPSAGAWQPLAAWLRARLPRLGERSSP